MTEQREMEIEYEKLIERRAELKGMANKTKYKDVQERINEISRGLKESTSKLVASLKENPNVNGNLNKVERDRKEAIDLLNHLNQELRNTGTFSSLSHKVDHEDSAIERHRQLFAKDRELNEAIARLEEDLRVETETFQRNSKERKDTIIVLKEEIHRFKGNTTSNTQFKKRESLAKVASVVREFKLQERVYELKIDELQEQLATEQVVNAETRAFLLKKQQSVVEDIGRWDGRLEAESGDKDKAIKAILKERDALMVKLTGLQHRKKLEEDEKTALEEKRKADEVMARHKEAMLMMKRAAAQVISKRLWLFKEHMKMERNPPSKKDKGKGKGGDKKKK